MGKNTNAGHANIKIEEGISFCLRALIGNDQIDDRRPSLAGIFSAALLPKTKISSVDTVAGSFLVATVSFEKMVLERGPAIAL